MALTYRNLFNSTAACLNALDVYATDNVSSDPAYSEYEIADAIIMAELKIIETICKTPGHRRKIKYASTSSNYTTSPTSLPDNIGDIIEVRIQQNIGEEFVPGEPCASQVVGRFAGNLNPLSLTLYKGLYSLEDNILWFTGNAAKVVSTTFTRPASPTDSGTLATFLATTASLPDENWGGCVALAVAKLLPKEGALTQAGMYYTNLGMAELQSIQQNSSIIPTFQQYQENKV
jgi:hypothetical protein